ncbi:hypothetical protein ASD54_17540 [Rhizobium sp. Root149]|jgi:predicted TIM-barrel fold metal-dependent hydrolase|nr:hypothetical protein ASD54_17540 [Rhizobium sp. Root149]
MQVNGLEHFEFCRKSMQKPFEAPNVACKIYGFGVRDFTRTTGSIRPYEESPIEIFGVDCCMFASNFPLDKLFSSYNTIFNAFKEITSSYLLEDRMKLFQNNVEKF